MYFVLQDGLGGLDQGKAARVDPALFIYILLRMTPTLRKIPTSIYYGVSSVLLIHYLKLILKSKKTFHILRQASWCNPITAIL